MGREIKEEIILSEYAVSVNNQCNETKIKNGNRHTEDMFNTEVSLFVSILCNGLLKKSRLKYLVKPRRKLYMKASNQ